MRKKWHLKVISNPREKKMCWGSRKSKKGRRRETNALPNAPQLPMSQECMILKSFILQLSFFGEFLCTLILLIFLKIQSLKSRKNKWILHFISLLSLQSRQNPVRIYLYWNVTVEHCEKPKKTGLLNSKIFLSTDKKF